VAVLAGGRLRDGRPLLYVRRGYSFGGTFAGYVFDLFRGNSDGTWSAIHAPKSLVSFLCENLPGASGKAGRSWVEVVNPEELVTGNQLVVAPPPEGWPWQRASTLSTQEEANVRYNLRLKADEPLPLLPAASATPEPGDPEDLPT